jgi:hypothetical protein
MKKRMLALSLALTLMVAITMTTNSWLKNQASAGPITATAAAAGGAILTDIVPQIGIVGQFTSAVASVIDTVICSIITLSLGHSWENWRTTTSVSCTNNGRQERRCTNRNFLLGRCRATETRAIVAPGHLMSENHLLIQATCIAPGLEGRQCRHSGCGLQEMRATPETGHTLTNWQTISPPTFQSTGLETRHCFNSNCGHTESRVIELLPPPQAPIIVSPPEPCNHTWSEWVIEWVITHAATCETEGERTRICKNCNELQILPIPSNPCGYCDNCSHDEPSDPIDPTLCKTCDDTGCCVCDDEEEHNFRPNPRCGRDPCRDCNEVRFTCGECNVCSSEPTPEPTICETCRGTGCCVCDANEEHNFRNNPRCGDNCRDCNLVFFTNCNDCETCVPVVNPTCDCRSCADCGFHGGRFGFGRVLNNGEPSAQDALQILRYITGLSNIIGSCDDARAAANIETPGFGAPIVQDALHILRFAVGLPNALNNLRQ